MDKCLSRHVAATVARVAVVVALLAPVAAAALQGGAGQPTGAKVDSAVRDWHDRGQGKDRQRVIIRVKRGQRSAVDRTLRAGGLAVKAHHALIDAITVEIPRSALRGLRHNPNVETISLDAQTTSFQTVAPNGQTVRSTLGVASSGREGHWRRRRRRGFRDRRVGRLRQPHRRVLRLHDRRRRRGAPERPVRSRHTRGGPDRRLRRSLGRRLSRDRHQRHADRPQGARWGRVGLHEPRHCGPGVCGHPTGRPSGST